MNQEDAFGAIVLANPRIKVKIRSNLVAPGSRNALALAVQQEMARARSA